MRRGRLLLVLGDYPGAVQAFRSALEDAPDDRMARQYVARAYLSRGRYTEARAEIEQALERTPGDPDLCQLLGALHLERAFAQPDSGEARAAVAAFRQAIALAADRPTPHYYLGVAYGLQDSTARAEEAYRAALRADSTMGPAHRKLGQFHRRRGEVDQALAHFERAARHCPDDADALFYLGLTYRSADRYEEALQTLERAVELASYRPQIHLNLGYVLMRLGRQEDGRAKVAFSEGLRRLGRGELAERLKPGMGGVCISAASTHLDTACARAGRGEYELALLEYQNAIDVNPDLKGAFSGLGILLARHGALEEAAVAFRRAISLDRRDPVNHARLALVCFAQGEDAAARVSLERATRLDRIMAEAVDGQTLGTAP